MDKRHNKTFIGLVGAIAASLTISLVSKYEGTRLTGYLDPVGIPTKCTGDTTNVTVGKTYSEAECKQSLETELKKHAQGVLRCTPLIKDKPYILAASISFAYNIGVGAYCNSTTARRFNNADYAGGCKAMNESDNGKRQWVTAKGIVLPGLVKRRQEERSTCEKGLK